MVGCNETNNHSIETDKTAPLVLNYAQNFKLISGEEGTTIQIIDPESKKIEHTISPKQIQEFQKKQRIVALSSTHIGMLSKLNELESVIGIQNIDYVHNATIKSNFRAKKIIQFGDESMIPLEKLISAKPGIIMYSGFNKRFPHQEQLEKLGILVLPNYDWKENHPLGKAEWIKLFGVLYGEEEKAVKIFNELKIAYLELEKEAMRLSDSKPVLSGNIFGDIWYTPAGESYYAQLFRDARINYPYSNSKGTGSLAFGLEKVLTENKHAKFWINPGANSLNELQTINSKAKFFDAFKAKQVYCYTPSGNKYWELAVIEPHHVLSDLIQISHPKSKITEELYFYSKLE